MPASMTATARRSRRFSPGMVLPAGPLAFRSRRSPQPLTLDDQPRGTAVLAVDALGAGVHEKVLIVMEGRAAGEALGRKLAPVDAAVIGIIDNVDVPASPTPRGGEGGIP